MNDMIQKPVLVGIEDAGLTMSSREIAELCEKRHDHVLRDIDKMIQDIADPKFGVSDFQGSYKDSTGRSLKEYRLPKDLTVTLITGYRADLRYRVVKRLEELEKQRSSGGTQIDLNDPAQLRGLLLNYSERAEQLEQRVQELLPSEEALERLSRADGSFNITEAAKALQMRPKDLFSWLSQNGWTYKRTGSPNWLGYQSKTAAGLLEHKVTTVLRADGSEKVTEQVRVTAKGLTRLAKLLKPSIGPA